MNLEVRKLSKSYSENIVLDDIHFSCESGVIYGLIGANGAGKTTLLHCLLGQTPFQGHVQYNGIDNAAYLRGNPAQIGYVPAEVTPYSYLKGKEYIQFCCELKGVNYHDVKNDLDEYANGFELTSDFDRLVGTYSFGMKRKLAIIASLVGSPKFLVMDEPFNGLDTLSTIFLKKKIQDIRSQGSLIIMTSHLMDSMAHQADKIFVLHKRKIVADFHMGTDIARDPHDLERRYLAIIGQNR